MEKKTYILFVGTDAFREDVEYIEGNTFLSKKDFDENEFVKKIKSMASLSLIPIYEFTTMWNDSDGEANYLNNEQILEHWLGYVYIWE